MVAYCGRIWRKASSICHNGIPSKMTLSSQKLGKLQMVPQVVNGVEDATFSFVKIGHISLSSHPSGTSTSVLTSAT